MIVDPVEAFTKATATLPLTSPTAVDPIPTIHPNLPEYEKATETGNRTLWVVFVVMLVATILFSGLSWNVPASKRLYHVITTFIVVFASLSYFAMAAGHGVGYHHVVETVHNKHGVPDTHQDVYREVYWARYVDWSVTTPLLLLDLALLAGLNGANILIAVVADIIMILTGLFAAFGSEDTPQKWGWYAIACIAYLVVIWQLAYHGRGAAFAKGGKVGNFFAAIGGFTLIIWTVYPIVWGIADGSRNLNVDEEIIAYAVLDILAKPIFGAWLLFTHASIPETNVDIGGFWAHGLSGEGQIRVGDDDEGA
ncbi:family A G protein-coupled receptor-like protein [Teratosphaeria nubilosa]|uniref:Family A G protein-coupled receptor-like protein n=1 Tax=Teratosphaeria nubilosa TaxID=161662 RepID=A0A6G1LAY1_9PEZI|nr:family A G protein-coupled receptor-like protein [Teratosphaeria nubilosa]